MEIRRVHGGCYKIPPMAENDRRAEVGTRTQTEMESPAFGSPGGSLIPGLTVLYHPDSSRVGDRMLLAGLGSGRRISLSRVEGELAQPGGQGLRSLDEVHISRSPLRFSGLENGAVQLEVAPSRTRVEADGQTITDRSTFSAEQIEAGVMLTLAGQVLLLLHLVEPLTDARADRWGLLGEAPSMIRVRDDIRQVADLEVPVLVRGESGTGKELVARALHQASPRKDGPFVAVNMAAIPPSLAASELFGAAKGAFTGAGIGRQGFFARAEGGTLFLDEIGEAPPEIQVLLLRALETGEIQSVGAEKPQKVDVRVVSATDADLEAGIEKERFRAPLLHRLSGYVIHLPPLRRRREDFGRLFVHFLRRELETIGGSDRLSAGRSSRTGPWIPVAWVARLAAWHWPGNVRQLANVVRQLVIANRGVDPAVRCEAVDELLRAGVGTPVSERTSPEAQADPLSGAEPTEPVSRRPSDITEAELVAALRAHRFRPAAAADGLGIPRSSIYDLMERCPGVRKAADLKPADIEEVRGTAAGSVEKAAELLEVSAQALRRRLKYLRLQI